MTLDTLTERAGGWYVVTAAQGAQLAAVARARGWRVLVDSGAWFIACEPRTMRYLHIDRTRLFGKCDPMVGH
jgi:hypothetical protein